MDGTNMAGRIAYCQQCCQSGASNALGGFTHVVAEHAKELVQMIVADRSAGQKKEMANAWKRLGHINDQWVGLLCSEQEMGKRDEFVQITSCLVHGYTESVGDFIFEGACHAQTIAELTETESKFYSALQNASGNRTMRTKWVQYTNALVDYVGAVDKFGPTHDVSWGFAADVLVAGRMLGTWLDQSILSKR